MQQNRLLSFFEKLHELSQAMLAAREESDWEKIQSLAIERQSLIDRHDDNTYPPPSQIDRQKIRSICQEIQKSDAGILDEATQWREQIRQFILK